MEALSYAFIDELADNILTQYFGSQRFPLKRIDIDAFAREYLNLTIREAQLSFDGETIYGLTAMEDTTIGLPEHRPKEFLNIRKNMILVDTSLSAPGKEAQRAFTIAHECGHHVLSRLMPEDIHRQSSSHAFSKPGKTYHIPLDWNEWQANVFASAVLMPKYLIDSMQLINNHTQNYIIYDNSRALHDEKQAIRTLAKSLGVSYSAMLYRLKKLNKVDQYSFLDYLSDADEERIKEGSVYGPFFGRSGILCQNSRRARPAQDPIIVTCD